MARAQRVQRICAMLTAAVLCLFGSAPDAGAQVSGAYDDKPIAVRYQILDTGYSAAEAWMLAEDDACDAYRLYMARQQGNGQADHGYWRYELASPSVLTWNHVSGGTAGPTTWLAIDNDGLAYGFSGIPSNNPAALITQQMIRLQPVEWEYSTFRQRHMDSVFYGMIGTIGLYYCWRSATLMLHPFIQVFRGAQ